MTKLYGNLRTVGAVGVLCCGAAMSAVVASTVVSEKAFAQSACDGKSCANSQPCGTLCTCNTNDPPTCLYNVN